MGEKLIVHVDTFVDSAFKFLLGEKKSTDFLESEELKNYNVVGCQHVYSYVKDYRE